MKKAITFFITMPLTSVKYYKVSSFTDLESTNQALTKLTYLKAFLTNPIFLKRNNPIASTPHPFPPTNSLLTRYIPRKNPFFA
jgi:hypothetical protein